MPDAPTPTLDPPAAAVPVTRRVAAAPLMEAVTPFSLVGCSFHLLDEPGTDRPAWRLRATSWGGGKLYVEAEGRLLAFHLPDLVRAALEAPEVTP